MLTQYTLWTTGLLVVVLLQTITIINTKDVTTEKQTISSQTEAKKSSDLETSETSRFRPFSIRKDLFTTYYYPPAHASLNPIFIYYPYSSNPPKSTIPFDFAQNTSDDIHQQIRCGDNFPRSCQDSRYRSYDGSCNNLQNPTWGMANTRYGRLICPRYSDGIQAPTKSITGKDLPLARQVSYTMFPNVDIDDPEWTLLTMQYGQIMSHDMGLIDGTTQSKSHRTRCCTFNGQLVPNLATMPQCFPILIPRDDPVYSQASIQCLNFVRSTTDLDRGCAAPYKPAEQLNTVTHYLDLSVVYGSNDEVAASLRLGIGGRLNVEMKNKMEFPPPAPNKTAICDIVNENEPCYATGDSRANQNPQLTILQIVFLREHNRIANFLSNLNPHWNDETIFQETRRIVIAEHQKISYYEWLPIFLGFKQLRQYKVLYSTQGYVNDYNETIIGHLLNEHSNAANRYFHSLITGHLELVSEDRDYSLHYDLRLSDYFNRPGIIERNHNLDDLTRGLSYQAQRAADTYFDKEITQYLFKRGRRLGSDLRATDIQRDRDHGLASYNDYRENCGLPRAKNFQDFSDYISYSDIQKLSRLYTDPDDIELTVGGSLERHINGLLVGPTFWCIMIKQFQLTRIGDRYWFETGDPKVSFTPEQLREIRKASISRLLCDNGNHIQYMQQSGFLKVSDINSLMNCNQLQQINLSLWKDYRPETDDYNRRTTRVLYKK